MRFLYRALVLFHLLALLNCASYTPIQVMSATINQGSERKVSLDGACQKGATGACLLLGQEVEVDRQFSIIQGTTESEFTNITVMLPKDKAAVYAVLERVPETPGQYKSMKIVASHRSDQRRESEYKLEHLEVHGLSPTANYELWVLDSQGQILDQREFRTLTPEKKQARIVVASCMDEGFQKEQEASWALVASAKPDVMFFIGDNVYTNKFQENRREESRPETIWSRYVQVRNALDLYHWRRLVPTYAIWDDNDYGVSDGDTRYPYKKESLAILRSYFPLNQGPTLSHGPGAAFALDLFGQRFLFLDDRSFRTPNKQGGPEQSHFGKGQENWALKLAKDSAVPVWFMSGDQFFGGYHSFESFEGSHPKNFSEFLIELKRVKAPFAFVSGDRHLTEILRVQKSDDNLETVELTTSGIHAQTFANALTRNPTSRRIAAAAGPYNFMEINLRDSAPDVLAFDVKAWGAFEGLLYEKDFKVSHRFAEIQKVRRHKRRNKR